MPESDIKNEVRQFYDSIGWQTTDSGFYQNARYEDLRPVSAEYIHKCHLRINRHIINEGDFLLDAGSGPIQYPEYLTYSKNYRFRVCVDLSIVALKEARKRIQDHGLFVVADVSHLPFKEEVFTAAVSLHTFHHLPVQQQKSSYLEIHRVLKKNCSAVIVNGWTDSPLMNKSQWLVRLMESIGNVFLRFRNQNQKTDQKNNTNNSITSAAKKIKKADAVGTFIQKMTPDWLSKELGNYFPIQIWVWRSVNVRFLRAVIHQKMCGKFLLKILFFLEEKFPRYFGEKGQYPLIVMEKN